MNRKTSFAMLSGSAFVAFLAAAAPAEAGRVHNREQRQQDRIAQGVGSGSLTARETARLEGREAHLDREVSGMRAANGGTLTPREHLRLERQQDRLSRGIYRQKHDGQTQ